MRVYVCICICTVKPLIQSANWYITLHQPFTQQSASKSMDSGTKEERNKTHLLVIRADETSAKKTLVSKRWQGHHNRVLDADLELDPDLFYLHNHDQTI